MKKNFLFTLGLVSLSFLNFNFVPSDETAYYLISWTSTCGTKHLSKFPTSMSESEIKSSLADFNKTQCGNYPTKVNLNLNINAN